MNEDKASRFHRLRRRAAVTAAAWSVLLMALLMATGGSVWLRDWAWGPLGHQPGGSSIADLAGSASRYALCAVAIALAHESGAGPIAFFAGFVLERRYGLSRQTAGDWCRDHLKALAVGLVLVALSAAFLNVAIRCVREWWLAATAGAVAVSVVLTWLAPVVLIPLFFTLTPLEDGSLRQRLAALCRRAGTGPVGIYRWRLSQKTSRANAAVTGLGRTRRILLSDTLVGSYSDDEIEVILAHELSHHVSRDVWWAIGVEAVVAALGFMAGSLALERFGRRLDLGQADPSGLPVVVLAFMGVSALALPLANAMSRWRERRADRFALDTTRNPAAFIGAMKRLGASNLLEEDPPVFARLFFCTHPPLGDRLAFARAWTARPQGEGSD